MKLFEPWGTRTLSQFTSNEVHEGTLVVVNILHMYVYLCTTWIYSLLHVLFLFLFNVLCKRYVYMQLIHQLMNTVVLFVHSINIVNKKLCFIIPRQLD